MTILRKSSPPNKNAANIPAKYDEALVYSISLASAYLLAHAPKKTPYPIHNNPAPMPPIEPPNKITTH